MTGRELLSLFGTIAVVFVGCIVNWTLTVYYYGRLTKAVENNAADIADARSDIKDLRDVQTEHGERLAHIEGPRGQGFVNGRKV